MSTPLRTSYPVPVEDLIPAARRLAVELGEIPSQNRLMKHLRIGKDKAKAVHAALTEERVENRPETRLHSVPDPDETGTETETITEVTETALESVEEEFPQVTEPVAPVPVKQAGWLHRFPRLIRRGGTSSASGATADTDARRLWDGPPITAP